MISQQDGIVIRKPKPAKLSQGKQIIYRFNGDPKYDETVSDSAGSLPLRRVGEVVARNGKQWRVAIVRDDIIISASRVAVPIHHVFLTDKL
jgi:hypothetical protein